MASSEMQSPEVPDPQFHLQYVSGGQYAVSGGQYASYPPYPSFGYEDRNFNAPVPGYANVTVRPPVPQVLPVTPNRVVEFPQESRVSPPPMVPANGRVNIPWGAPVAQAPPIDSMPQGFHPRMSGIPFQPMTMMQFPNGSYTGGFFSELNDVLMMI